MFYCFPDNPRRVSTESEADSLPCLELLDGQPTMQSLVSEAAMSLGPGLTYLPAHPSTEEQLKVDNTATDTAIFQERLFVLFSLLKDYEIKSMYVIID